MQYEYARQDGGKHERVLTHHEWSKQTKAKSLPQILQSNTEVAAHLVSVVCHDLYKSLRSLTAAVQMDSVGLCIPAVSTAQRGHTLLKGPI